MKIPSPKAMKAVAERRRSLEENKPISCPSCLFGIDIELTDWFGRVARWRCKDCGHRFKHEPLII